MNIQDLSFRFKLPLWGGLIIVVTATAMSLMFMASAYSEIEEDLEIDSETLGLSLAPGLSAPMQNDNVWRVYELIRAPLRRSATETSVQADNILVVDRRQKVFAAARPRLAPVQADLRGLGPEYAELAAALDGLAWSETRIFRLAASEHLVFVTPVIEEDAYLGRLLIVMARRHIQPRFIGIAWQGVMAGGLLLAVMLPVNWYWGRRLAQPLVRLTENMGEIGRRLPADLEPPRYGHDDEIGRLFGVYNQMLAELRAKDDLERQVVQSERMAALGQLAAGVAHEINNPLGGMLTAIDTLKCQKITDPRTAKTIDLIERGLTQIKDTVGALLVEARVKGRDLKRQDVEDVRVLVTPKAREKSIVLDWRVAFDEVRLPATLVRQILINLALNGIQAAGQRGRVCCDVGIGGDRLKIIITNDGALLSDEQMSHLFEPFFTAQAEGHGLGLWVTYQIVHQLGGRIGAVREGNQMRFTVELPIGGLV